MNQNVSAEVCSLFDYVLQVFSELSAIEAETDRINSEIAAAGGDVDPKLIERQHALNENTGRTAAQPIARAPAPLCSDSGSPKMSFREA